MAYRVEITRRAVRQFDGLPSEAQKRVNRLFDLMAADPRGQGAVKLKGPDDLYRMRAGNWRVVYAIRDAVLLVVVVRIGHRRDVYR